MTNEPRTDCIKTKQQYTLNRTYNSKIKNTANIYTLNRTYNSKIKQSQVAYQLVEKIQQLVTYITSYTEHYTPSTVA